MIFAAIVIQLDVEEIVKHSKSTWKNIYAKGQGIKMIQPIIDAEENLTIPMTVSKIIDADTLQIDKNKIKQHPCRDVIIATENKE